MFTITPDYNSSTVSAFCAEHNIEFKRNYFTMTRFENGGVHSWAVFHIDLPRAVVVDYSADKPIDADLLIRAGINAAEMRGCLTFSFDWDLWGRVCDDLMGWKYTNCTKGISEFLSSCDCK